ncbi:MAG: DUF3084 domain-containing protein [Armatimonadota bacterium]
MMASYTVAVFVALAALGALIAYVGDLVGAWLGKRRSTLFGMRPRRSARLIAAVIGAILPLIGLGVATLGSQYARIAVFQLRSVIQQREKLTGQVTELQRHVSEYERRVGAAEQRAGDAEEEAARLFALQEDAQERMVALRARRDELAGRVQALTARRDELVAQLGSAQTQLQAAEHALEKSEGDLTITRRERERLAAEVAEKRRDVETLTAQVGIVTRDLGDAHRELEAAQAELEDTERRIAQSEQRLADIQEAYEQAQRRQELVAEQPALFEPGDELIRVVLSADETQDQMEADLYELLHLASGAAQRRGVPEGPNGRAVVVVAPIPAWAPARDVPEGMIVRYVASELRTRGPDEWVVVVRAFRRLFPDDDSQLAVEFRATPNRLVFRAGEVLDEFTISSDATALQAFEAIWQRITSRQESLVRAKAIAAGMLPHPETGNYGSVDLAEIFQAAEAIRADTGGMRVRIMAAQDTYTRGPLLLDIQVTKAEAS